MKMTAKRLLALALVLIIAVGVISVTAMADGTGMPVSYDFVGESESQVAADWTIINGDGANKLWTVGANGLVLTTHFGDYYGTYTEGETTTPLAKSVFVQKQKADADNWVVETHVTFDKKLEKSYQQAALMLFVDSDNYLKFSYEFNYGYGYSDGGPYFKMMTETGGSVSSSYNAEPIDCGQDVYLRLEKKTEGSQVSFLSYYSTDGITFTQLHTVTGFNPEGASLAIAANNGGSGNTDPVNATFSYVAVMTAEEAAAVEDAEKAIAAIGTVTLDSVCAGRIQDARNAYNAVSTVVLRDVVVGNYQTLLDAEAAYKALEDQAAANAVINLIHAIGGVENVDLDSYTAINDADQAYKNLTLAQQAKVTNAGDLTAAWTEFNALYRVYSLINKIDATITLDSYSGLSDALEAFNKLTPAQQLKITNTRKLNDAREAYNALYHVYSLIEKIGEVTLDSYSKLSAALEAFNALTADQQAKITNSDELVASQQEFNALYRAYSAINAIKEPVTLDSYSELSAALEAFNKLTPAQQAKVTNRAKLTVAQKEFNTLYHVYSLINAIDEPVTLDSYSKLTDALEAFNALTTDQQAKITNSAKLAAAQKEFNTLYHVYSLIEKIGEVTLDSNSAIEAAEEAYGKLSDAQKAKITNATELFAARTEFNTIYHVYYLINQIGEVTLDSNPAIEAAEAAYEALTDAQKDKITNIATLTAARTEFNTIYHVYYLISLIDAPVEVETGAEIVAAEKAYAALTTAQKAKITNYKKLVDSRAAYDVVVLINAIGRVTLSKKDEINTARAAYEALTADQKALVSNLDVLEAAERQYKKLVLLTIAISGAATDFPFSDVPTNAWYYDAVKEAWENDLIDGMSATEFQPEGSLTVAQAIKLAAALNQMYRFGEVTLENGTSVWYSTYVNYAVNNGIVEADYAKLTAAEMNAPITREEFVHIFYGAMPEMEYGAWNTVLDNNIPDVKLGDNYADEIYTFYRAGILTGSDPYGTFHPESNIRRCEVAAILIRMYDATARQIVLLG